jgi:hypothetical protein
LRKTLQGSENSRFKLPEAGMHLVSFSPFPHKAISFDSLIEKEKVVHSLLATKHILPSFNFRRI